MPAKESRPSHPLPSSAEVVIIGGGIMGASIAYHLAKRGCPNVVVLERAEMFGLGSTGLNAGGVRHQFSTSVNIQLSKMSIAMMERFAVEMDQEVGLKRCGYLFLLDNEADLSQFRANVALQNSLGVPSSVLGHDEVARLVPEADLSDIVGGTWCPRDGLVDPNGLLQGYVSNARRLGSTLITDCAAIGIEERGIWIRRVLTNHGPIDTPHVVITAGPWSASIGAMAGVDIPIVPIRRQIAVTSPIPGLRPDFPFVIDFARALYAHREGTGILTGMSNRDEAPGFDTTVDDEWRLQHVEQAIARFPFLGEAEISAEWAGLYEVTPDDQPVIGAVPGHEGLYVCAGFSGHGLMHGPVAGLLMAEEILDGEATTIDVKSLGLNRFAAGKALDEYNVI